MKSPVVATILSALSLGGVAVLWFEVDDLKDMMQTRVSQAGRQVPNLDASARDEAGASRARPRPPSGIETAAAGSAAPLGSPAPEGGRSDPDAPPGAKESAEAATRRAGDSAVPLLFMNGRIAGSLDELERQLDLTVPQRDRVAQAVERGRLRIEEILKIPDETGRSPHERREERSRKLREAIENRQNNPEGATAGVLTLATEFLNYRNRQIPGRNATYGQEIDRIERETRAEIASTLNPQQKETFEQTSIDPMLGGGGGRAVSFIMGSPDGGEASLVIETGFEATAVEDAPAAETPAPGQKEPAEGDG